MEKDEYIEYCNDLKLLMFEMMKNGKSGHIGGSLSCIEMLAVLYNEFLQNTDNKFVFSKGHCEVALYSLLIKEKIIEKNCIKSFKCFGSILQGHPSTKWICKLDYSPGTLGQGLSFALGLALSNRSAFNVYAVLGDGELQEGQIWEAVIAASKFRVNNLFVLVDCNNMQLEGATYLTGNANEMANVWKGLGWNTFVIDNGNDIDQLLSILRQRLENCNPSVYFIKTKKGNGISFMENNCDYHGTNISAMMIDRAIQELLIK